MKRIVAIFGIMIGVACVITVSAQQPQSPQPSQQAQQPRPSQNPAPPAMPRHPHSPTDPLADGMFPPEMIMQHQRELALTEDQKTFMRGEIQRTTLRFNELQWQLQDAMELLRETTKASSVNEQLALSQLDKILEAEREIKRLHMELAIRLKNKLTADQQTKLQAIKQSMRPRGDGPGAGPGVRPGHPPGGFGPGGQSPPRGQPPKPGGHPTPQPIPN